MSGGGADKIACRYFIHGACGDSWELAEAVARKDDAIRIAERLATRPGGYDRTEVLDTMSKDQKGRHRVVFARTRDGMVAHGKSLVSMQAVTP